MSTLGNVIGFSKTEGKRKERVERKRGGERERERERDWWKHFAGEKLMQSLGVRKWTVCLKASWKPTQIFDVRIKSISRLMTLSSLKLADEATANRLNPLQKECPQEAFNKHQ